MTSTRAMVEAIALFSKNGRTWSDGSPVVPWQRNEAVTKIVIGSLKRSDEEPDEAGAVALPESFADLFPNLTHLHVWGLRALEVVPPVPSGLQCLDVRGCEALTSLPTVTDSLTSLDLGGCRNVTKLPSPPPARLERLFVNECVSLKRRALESFLADLRESASNALIELDASACSAVVTLDEFPRSIERLVLAGCPKLEDLETLPEFERLDHVDLRDCPALQSLPMLPKSVRYLELRGSDKLTRFIGQDLGPYDRGTEDRPNVARIFRSRIKFGEHLATSAHAKLLLLGDGRVGKTTLAKRLQWDCLTPAQQRDPALAHLRPRADEVSTHKVQFAAWSTPLQLDAPVAVDLNERAASARVAPPCDQGQRVPGVVHLWDFGGQEIYHETHRLFAAEGSVFVVVWSADPYNEQALAKLKPADVTDDEWNAWNRQRPLDYWLDYIASIRRDPKVILVCTHCRRGDRRVAWTERATRHANNPLECFYIDSLEEDCPRNPDYQRLVQRIRELCGTEAARIGILQPAFYSQMSALVDAWLAENDAARRAERRRSHLLLSFADWAEALRARHRDARFGTQELDDGDVDTITGYLHDAGQIFNLRERGNSGVLVDQDWATDLIYEMLRPGGRMARLIRRRGGLFEQSALEDDRSWQALDSDEQRRLLLDYMEQCGIIVRLVDAREQREGKTFFLATEKWLLPPFTEVESALRQRFDALSGPASDRAVFTVGDGSMREFDFRDLMVHLGRILGARATWFREGLQAVKVEPPSWCFEVKWRRTEGQDFWGTVAARLVADRTSLPRLTKEIEDVLADAQGSVASRRHTVRRRPSDEHEPWQHLFRDSRNEDFDVAISNSGQDLPIVEQLHAALCADRLRPFWYKDEACRAGETAKVMQLMKALRRPPCVLLFLSDAYLRDDPDANWYCIWELADAINQLASGKRSPEGLLVVYAEGGTLTSSNVHERAVQVLRRMAKAFHDKYNSLSESDQVNFAYYGEFHAKFRDAADSARKFAELRGTMGSYSTIKGSNGNPDFSGVIADIRKALKSSRPSPAG